MWIHLTLLPVSDEPVYAKRHELEQGLDDEDAGEHVVTVLQNLSQILRTQTQAHGFV